MEGIKYTFNDIPQAVTDMYEKLINIEHLLYAHIEKAATNSSTVMSIDEAAKFLGLSKATLYKKVSQRLIPVSKQGKKLYFSSSDLTAWLDTGRRKTNAEINIAAAAYLTSPR